MEASLKMLQTDPTFRDGMEEKVFGKTLQRKRQAILSSITAAIIIIATVCVLPIALLARKKILPSENSVYTACPEGWIGFGRKCFYFSEEIRNWTHSRVFCASKEADLIRLDTLEELNFLRRYKGPSDHWIGFSRESRHHAWKWTDDTVYNGMFVIKGVGVYAHLNDNGLSSARSYTEKKWICSKPNVCMCQIPSGS